MNKYLAVLLVISGLTSCSAKNEHYYKSHPNELQQAIKSCPKRQPQGMTCEQLEALANRMNQLAYQLQLSPQGFGKKIISLQETIAKQQVRLKTETTNENLQADLTQNKRDLADHLAVVRWFESPTS
ncbi:hypothetical protein OQJ18_06060 [Fluoribacter dumoffii]|uniref:Secreted endonuclease n=1 Tax=Fluoribacter dumoffii TaxID=463 RepID=A0A377G8H1_9GAMM|nr:hypothetical protein [Fluoribacter dumoffii]KTC89997.1 secreted endonuclease [Fluoribacter dumoffii NY 23]MCW8385294.1 hypothetical protein [Fluoribacter dumoffii]MCW8418348.1 hypothetical protein [Fluoribacter dumoffii]MCW8453810.1 hypothetical protein [Fluoribacter dumoffii]MCW8462119.1 hypothetical protein [Fluoribacter dumoffii]